MRTEALSATETSVRPPCYGLSFSTASPWPCWSACWFCCKPTCFLGRSQVLRASGATTCIWQARLAILRVQFVIQSSTTARSELGSIAGKKTNELEPLRILRARQGDCLRQRLSLSALREVPNGSEISKVSEAAGDSLPGIRPQKRRKRIGRKSIASSRRNEDDEAECGACHRIRPEHDRKLFKAPFHGVALSLVFTPSSPATSRLKSSRPRSASRSWSSFMCAASL